MNLTNEEIEQFTKLIDQLNSSSDSAEQKVMVTPAVVVAMVLTTLSGLCLTAPQANAVKKFTDEVGGLPLNASLKELMDARSSILATRQP